MRLNGRNALGTGTAGRIGRAIAEAPTGAIAIDRGPAGARRNAVILRPGDPAEVRRGTGGIDPTGRDRPTNPPRLSPAPAPERVAGVTGQISTDDPGRTARPRLP